MLLKMFDVLVVRGMETEIPACVPRHEAELMAMIHGADGMRLRSEEPAGVLEFGDVRDERERLRLKYGLPAIGRAALYRPLCSYVAPSQGG